MTKRKTKEKIVCLDLDDSIVNFLPTLCMIYNREHDTCIAPIDFKEYNLEACSMTDARNNTVEGKAVKELFEDRENHGLYALLEVLPEAQHALGLIKKLGYKVYFITARSEKFKTQTCDNLYKHHIEFDELLFVKSQDKAKCIRRLAKDYNVVMFFDDKASTVIDVFENTNVNHVFLRNMPHNQAVEMDESITRVSGLFDTIRFLKDVN